MGDKVCEFEGCGRAAYCKLLCQAHYEQRRTGKVLSEVRYITRYNNKTCAGPECARTAVAKELCGAHNQQRWRGKPLTPISKRSAYGSNANHRYKKVDAKGHPNSRKDGKIFEHVLVMSNYLGRPLVGGENVHHRNGVRDDNRIENLELWNTTQPAGQRIPDKLAYALELLALYEPAWYNAVEEVRRTTMNQKAGTDASKHF